MRVVFFILRSLQWCTLVSEFRGHMWIILWRGNESLLLEVDDGITDHLCIVSLRSNVYVCVCVCVRVTVISVVSVKN